MPIYEYECLTCGTIFEKRQSFSEPPKAVCPNGHPDTRRRLAVPAIVFKGSGFYVTDNRTNGSTTKKVDTPSSSSEEKKPKTETKKEKAK